MENWKQWKWPPLVGGGVLAAAGLAALVVPDIVMNVLPLALGAALLGAGIVEALLWFALHGAQASAPPLLPALVGIAMGLVFLFDHDASLMFICVAAGLGAFVSGAVRLYGTLRRRRQGAVWADAAVDAAARMLVGVLLVAQPFRGLAALTRLFGVLVLIIGVSIVWSAVYVDRLVRRMGALSAAGADDTNDTGDADGADDTNDTGDADGADDTNDTGDTNGAAGHTARGENRESFVR